MGIKRQLGECLDLDLEKEVWCCNRCGFELISARENFKKGCLIYARDPRTITQPLVDEEFNFATNPDWARFVEFYCPQCGVLMDCETLPPGHPITWDIQPDIDNIKRRYLKA